jgi:ribose transport system substrate-binding protein
MGFLSLIFVALGCQDLVDDYVGTKPEDVRVINITMVAKSATNPVFVSALNGAEAAAKDLSEKYSKIEVRIDWRTPLSEDANAQAERMLNAVNDGTDAIMVSCSDSEILTTAINAAVDSGVPVMTFDSDAPNSKRFAFYGPDDIEIGERVMTELVNLMGDRGKVAILGGNENAPNLQKRIAGVQQKAGEFPEIEIVGVFYHPETAEEATAEVLRVINVYPDLKGWAMVGGWPLFEETLLNQIDPENLKIVAVDALPIQLPYIEKGVVPVLLGQPTFRWGKICVEKIIDKLYLDEEVPEINKMKLIRVYRDNLGGWARQLRAWGYQEIPRKYLKM